MASFQLQASHLRSLDAGSGNAALPAVAFQPMTSAQYADYILAFTTWKQACDTMDVTLHNQSVKKRALESYREVATLEDPTNFGHTLEVGDYVDMSSDAPEDNPLMVTITMQKKEAHSPTLSTHPHRGEKRDKKRKLRDAKVKAEVAKLEAITAITEAKTAPVIQERLEKVQELKDLRPLHREELVAAKSAVARSKQIRFGSSDVTTNIVPEEKWKVVTRKKGDYWPQFARVDHPADHTAVRMDPSIGSLGPIALASLRKPTATTSK